MMHFFEDVDGNFVEQFQTTAFDARFSELYLFALLTEQRMIFDRSYPAPDFVCEGLTGSLFVESVTVIPSRRGDIVVEPMRAILRNSSSTSRITCPWNGAALYSTNSRSVIGN